jgi:AraC-like DNA-binding protein
MNTPARAILLLHPDPVLLSSLRAAAEDGERVRVVADWDALERALRVAPPGAVAVVDPCFGQEGGPPSPRLGEILEALRSAQVVAAFPVSGQTVPYVETLVRWGVADLIDMGREETPGALRHRLGMVHRRMVTRLLDRALPRATPSRTRALLAAAAEAAAAGGGSAELARALGTTERTVLRWCNRADLPHPRRLFAWMRMLLAAEMLDDPGRPLAAVARACGYSGDAALRNAVRSFLGASPTSLRGSAFAAASTAFSRELFELRDAAHARGRPEKTWLH